MYMLKYFGTFSKTIDNDFGENKLSVEVKTNDNNCKKFV